MLNGGRDAASKGHGKTLGEESEAEVGQMRDGHGMAHAYRMLASA